MGNNHSQSKDKTGQLWSVWTPKEQEQLKQQYDAPDPLPKYFSTDLSTCFNVLLRSKDLAHYLEFAYQLVKAKDTQPVYCVFQQNKQISLKTFVSWVVASSIPLWFENGSSYDWIHDGDANLLVDYLLYHAKEKERRQKESMTWLDDQEIIETEQGESWENKTNASPSQITESEFLAWIDSTPGFLSLFQIAAGCIVLSGTTTIDHDHMHNKRVEHIASPRIQQHNKATSKLFGQGRFSNLLTAYDYFMLSLRLPSTALSWSEYEKTQRKVQDDLEHTLLFSSKRDGNSWQVFVGKMVGQGATFVVIKAKDGSVFGGYLDEAAECNTDWYGNSTNFLFRLRDKYGAWDGSRSSNDHFQYLCWGKKTLPNGFGMGGQFDYAGLWIEADFIHGHSKAGPLCTTFSSPQLSTDPTFIVDEVEGRFNKVI